MLWDSLQGWELIDTQWDVNSLQSDSYTINQRELIDTQWDVNTDLKDNSANADTELIDTQWDVNTCLLNAHRRALAN